MSDADDVGLTACRDVRFEGARQLPASALGEDPDHEVVVGERARGERHLEISGVEINPAPTRIAVVVEALR
jgi:hypothetical protein